MFIAFHGTSYQNAQAIEHHGFATERFPNWTSDLGAGVYGYIDDPDMPFAPPEYNATQYARMKLGMHTYGAYSSSRTPGNPRVGIVQFTVDLEGKHYCDFNDRSNLIRFLKLKKSVEALIHTPRFLGPGALARDNEDGIIIEWLIRQRKLRDYAVFIMETYTPFLARLSNFPNGREICVRDLTCIIRVRLIK
ncbi:hypothetical protein [Schleiferilactobacillus harbinensis]|uniref:hypothetical protein n=1 Tax=Schleiferilactobacillus harbinensis TaxID=304207 RepID=UPI00242C29F3|nr:hypothetical protein [Schleiferilactobacillus harbinensis]MCI1851023.1 hypothetical protein [Schleiferilactobacillus harbinensis]